MGGGYFEEEEGSAEKRRSRPVTACDTVLVEGMAQVEEERDVGVLVPDRDDVAGVVL